MDQTLWEYQVIPFLGSTYAMESNPAGSAARQLQALMMEHAIEGWEYLRLETLWAEKTATAWGCLFGGGASTRMVSYQVAVFRRRMGR